LFEIHDEFDCFLGDGYIVIGADENLDSKFVLDFSHLPAKIRWVNVQSFRRLPEVPLARNSENIFEFSEWGSTSHEFTTRMKWSLQIRRR
jgi:hypothetical protein